MCSRAACTSSGLAQISSISAGEALRRTYSSPMTSCSPAPSPRRWMMYSITLSSRGEWWPRPNRRSQKDRFCLSPGRSRPGDSILGARLSRSASPRGISSERRDHARLHPVPVFGTVIVLPDVPVHIFGVLPTADQRDLEPRPQEVSPQITLRPHISYPRKPAHPQSLIRQILQNWRSGTRRTLLFYLQPLLEVTSRTYRERSVLRRHHASLLSGHIVSCRGL